MPATILRARGMGGCGQGKIACGVSCAVPAPGHRAGERGRWRPESRSLGLMTNRHLSPWNKVRAIRPSRDAGGLTAREERSSRHRP
jgi:hypothetical protein